jgi:hypothetical protein
MSVTSQKVYLGSPAGSFRYAQLGNPPRCRFASPQTRVLKTSNRATHAVKEHSPRPGLFQESRVTKAPSGAGSKVHNGPGLRQVLEPISDSFSLYRYLSSSDVGCAYPNLEGSHFYHLESLNLNNSYHAVYARTSRVQPSGEGSAGIGCCSRTWSDTSRSVARSWRKRYVYYHV